MPKELTKEEFYVLNDLYNASIGRTPIFSDLYLNEQLENSRIMGELIGKGYVEEQFESITAAGREALAPYRVSGAVIMAAGPATRCIPISLEKPKGLFEVRGERLIERQIRQLQEAGIDDITVVLGYKKEMFFYLREAFGVRLIENPDYLTKNNIYSLYAARDYLADAYVCSCDDYFAENPFNRYEYQSFYAGIHMDRKANEMYLFTDEDGRIVKMRENQDKGLVLLGHSYWNKAFAQAFLQLVDRDKQTGRYTSEFWEWMIKDLLDELPPFYFKRYARQAITEIDYFDDLRRFDSEYVKQSNSRILQNILSVFHCTEADVRNFRNVSEGMTNTSFIFQIGGVDYIYRHPGEGTEKIISRRNEKQSLTLAKKWGIDPTFVDMNVEEGWKISEFVHEFREPDYGSFEDSRRVLAVLRRLHQLPIKVDYAFRPWEDACGIERLLEENAPGCFSPYAALKAQIGTLVRMTENDGIEKCFCHADTYKSNWMLKPDGGVILIDWEYSGYADPGIDVGYYIVDAMYDFGDARRFILEYLEGDTDPKKMFHFLAYTAIIAYYWFVWALYREQCGAVIGESLTNWRDMAIRYADYLTGSQTP